MVQMRLTTVAAIVAGSMLCLPAAMAQQPQSKEVAQKSGGLSDQSVNTLMTYAWTVLPTKFTSPEGKTILVDKSKTDAHISLEVGREALLNSQAAWELCLRSYERLCPHVSFLDYFWTWRTLLLGVCSVLLAPMVPARVYHPLCTGYAGLYAARAHIETGRPVLLTEHGIYTNERRIEIAMADWLEERPAAEMSIALIRAWACGERTKAA